MASRPLQGAAGPPKIQRAESNLSLWCVSAIKMCLPTLQLNVLRYAFRFPQKLPRLTPPDRCLSTSIKHTVDRDFCNGRTAVFEGILWFENWALLTLAASPRPAPASYCETNFTLTQALQWHHIALEVREKGKGFVKGTALNKKGFADKDSKSVENVLEQLSILNRHLMHLWGGSKKKASCKIHICGGRRIPTAPPVRVLLHAKTKRCRPCRKNPPGFRSVQAPWNSWWEKWA